MSAVVAQRERAADLDRELLAMLEALVARAPLFADLRASGEADDLIQEAMIVVMRRMADGAVEDPFAYATRVVQNLARRAYVRRRPEDSTAEEDLVSLGASIDVADHVQQRFELAEVLNMVRAVTSVVRDLPVADVEMVRAELRRDDQHALARRLGMSRATFYRRKRRAVCGFVSAVARGARVEPCDEQLEALLAAAGGSGFAGAAGARAHARGCPGCDATLRHLAAARHGLGLLAPLPALAPPLHAGERASVVAQTIGDWMRGLLMRAPDPAAALPASKAAAAVAAACLGVGGGAYCAIDGVPGAVRHALGDPRPPAASARAAHRRATIAQAPTGPAPAVGAAPVTSRMPAGASRRRAGEARAEFTTTRSSAASEFGTPRPTRASAAQHEFRGRSAHPPAAARRTAPADFERSATAVAPAATAAAVARPPQEFAPAPRRSAPAGGSSEFGG